jgi:hypothetical protein
VAPPTTVEGTIASIDAVPLPPPEPRVIVSDPLFLTPPNDAFTSTAVSLDTDCVVTAKFAVVSPAGTTTVAGTDNCGEPPASSAIVAPPARAGEVSVTVPCEGSPPDTLGGLKESAARAGATHRTGGVIVSEVTRVAPPRNAPSATAVVTGTACVETTNEALVEPAGTTTLDGTIAVSGALLARFTVTLPGPAGAVRTTVACDVPPLVTADGETERLPSVG